MKKMIVREKYAAPECAVVSFEAVENVNRDKPSEIPGSTDPDNPNPDGSYFEPDSP